MNNLELSTIIKNNIGLKNLEQSGGGEGWDDITSLFTLNTLNNTFQTATCNITTITINDLIRVTVNTYNTILSKISGEIQTNPIRCVEQDTPVYYPTNSIQTSDEFGTGVVTYGGRITVMFLYTLGILTINYIYNDIIEAKPAILKIERLVENE